MAGAPQSVCLRAAAKEAVLQSRPKSLGDVPETRQMRAMIAMVPSAITATVITGLADAVGSVRAFDCEFAATGWFGEEAVWLTWRRGGSHG
jgi:hypothetical protein